MRAYVSYISEALRHGSDPAILEYPGTSKKQVHLKKESPCGLSFPGKSKLKIINININCFIEMKRCSLLLLAMLSNEGAIRQMVFSNV